MSRFTPGPWEARQYSNGIDWGIDAPFGDTRHPLEDYSGFATVYGSENYPRQGAVIAEANAKLIAAAPELLEALRACDEAMEYMSDYDIPITLPDQVKAAIAKATGE